MSGQAFAVRPYQEGDAARLERFYARVGDPYRAEDAAAVTAMHRHARQAQAAGDRWTSLPAAEHSSLAAAHLSLEAAHVGFWLAVAGGQPVEEIIGTVGLRRVGTPETSAADTAEHSGLSAVQLGAPAPHVGEVRRLRGGTGLAPPRGGHRADARAHRLGRAAPAGESGAQYYVGTATGAGLVRQPRL